MGNLKCVGLLIPTPDGTVFVWVVNISGCGWQHCKDPKSHSARQEILHSSLNLKVHYRVHKSTTLVPILNQTNTVHTLAYYFCNSNVSTTRPAISTSYKCPSSLHALTLCAFLIFHMPATCHTHFTIHDTVTLLIYPTYKDVLKTVFDMCHICVLHENSVCKINRTNARRWIVFITCYSLPTYFDLYRGHWRGSLQHYKVFKYTAKIHKLTIHYYKVDIKFLI